MRVYPINFVGHGTVGAASSRRNAIEACVKYAEVHLNVTEADLRWDILEKHEGRLLTDNGVLEFKMHQINEVLEDDA